AMAELDLPAWSEPFADDARHNLVRAAGLHQIDRAWAWGGATGAGVKVAIIDSGVEGSHPVVGGRLVDSVAVEIVDEEVQVVPDEPIDLYGHGTACAGIVVGLAPEVEIYSVRVLGADLRGKGAAFLAGLEWAVEKGVQAMNLSLSSKSERLFPFFHEVVDQAYFHQVCLVSAVNNVPGLSFPSTFSSVFSVAAHGIPEPETFFYNPSPPVEWGAWGVDVPIGWKDGATTVATGNSFAAPHMCGLVARILSKHPGLTPFEVKAVLAAIANDPAAAD
ncbi:MAG TPA: S8 family serine peptidase, partial [Candidatus Limnocylindrales bacterium]|nr:S8 family serine peptidase [Candidatus Limnocylindrales bacterium]